MLARLPAEEVQDSPKKQLVESSKDVRTDNLTTLYRACAGVTTFTVQDPDPQATDDGHVLGVRFDVCNSGRYIRPYYVMLSRATGTKNHLRVLHHTCPPCIHITALAARFLPSPRVKECQGAAVAEGPSKQDVTRFVRSVRREIVSYHLRLQSIKHLRKQFNLDEKSKVSAKKKTQSADQVIHDVTAIDAEAKEVRIEWTDGQIGRAVVNANGEIMKCVILGDDGRDRENERRILSHGRRMEQIGDRLMEAIY